jgi:hypothetical protein
VPGGTAPDGSAAWLIPIATAAQPATATEAAAAATTRPTDTRLSVTDVTGVI